MKIRKRRYPSGRVVWVADLGVVAGRRKEVACASESAAKGVLVEARRELRDFGRRASRLTERELLEWHELQRLVREHGLTLREAVEGFVRLRGRRRERRTLAELVAAFCGRPGLSERYARQLGVSLRSLVRACDGEVLWADELTDAMLEAWLAGGGWGAVTRRNYLGDVRACLRYGVERGWLGEAPGAGLKVGRAAEGEIAALTAGQVRRLLGVVAASGDACALWYVVLAVFGGIRPAEIERLEVGRINLAEGTVVVTGATAKTARRRVVELSGNALAWLRWMPLPEGTARLCGRGWEDRWLCLRRAAGWAVGLERRRAVAGWRLVRDLPLTEGPWPHDVLRHTYASMHYARWQNEALLKAQMGHWERADTLHRHYRAVRTKAEAVEFWAIVPG